MGALQCGIIALAEEGGDCIVYGEDYFRGLHRLSNFDSKSIGTHSLVRDLNVVTLIIPELEK